MIVISLPVLALLLKSARDGPKPNYSGGLNRGTPVPRDVSHHRRRSIFARCHNFRFN